MFIESIVVCLSYLGSATADSPKILGWVSIGASPFLWKEIEEETGRRGLAVSSALALAGIGAYNVFELSKDRYSKSDRFWLNMAAWNAGMGVVALASLMDPPRKAPASTSPSVSLGLTAGGGVLLVAGRF